MAWPQSLPFDSTWRDAGPRLPAFFDLEGTTVGSNRAQACDCKPEVADLHAVIDEAGPSSGHGLGWLCPLSHAIRSPAGRSPPNGGRRAPMPPYGLRADDRA